MSEEQHGQQFHEWKMADASIDQLLNDILESGLIVVARKGFGKTVTCKHIARAFMEKREDVRMVIADTCLNWRYCFDKIPYKMMETVVDSIPSVKHLIIDVPFPNPDDARLAISTIVLKDFDQMLTYKQQIPVIPYWNLYFIEEIQNIFGSYALNGYEGKFWLKMVSEGRNFNMNYVGIGQRLADISTKVVERAKGYLFGQLTGANCLKKVTQIAGKNVSEAVKSLPKGKWLFYRGDTLSRFTFPNFVPKGQPYEYTNGEQTQNIGVEDFSWLLKK